MPPETPPPSELGRLPLLEDPEHPGLFVVRRIGLITLLLVGVLGAGMGLAGSLVHLTVSVPGAEPPRTESMSLGAYVLEQLRHPRPDPDTRKKP